MPCFGQLSLYFNPSMNKSDPYTHHVPPPCDEPVIVCYADEDLLVVEKPAGLLSVPGRYVKDCVVQRMAAQYPGVTAVHRLDLDTSGLMVFALSKLAVRDLNRQFRERQVNKQYVARVFGHVEADTGIIDLPMRADWENRPRQVVDREGGKPSVTRFEVDSRTGTSTLLRLVPVTGRSHQLRVHLAAIDHPILGCDLYAHPAAFELADRLCLHASHLSFTHPASGQLMSFDSRCDFPA